MAFEKNGRSAGLGLALIGTLSCSQMVIADETVDWPKDDWGESAWAETSEPAFKVNGFVDALAGVRTRDNPVIAEDLTAAEIRTQVQSDYYLGDFYLNGRVDVLGDVALEAFDVQVRELYVSGPLSDMADIRVGRQVSTWGTGDLLFLNDLFPKDWESFFAGREVTYLKKPANAIKLGVYQSPLNAELVWTPIFAPDNVIDGERFSYYSPMTGDLVAADPRMISEKPSTQIENGEVAGRIYGDFNGSEVALYMYRGYFKQPLSFDMQAGLPTYSRMNSVGASFLRPLGVGIFNAEASWYDSVEDRDGTDPTVPNSQLRLLMGYQWEWVKNLNGGVQLYAEYMDDYDAFLMGAPGSSTDEWRQVVTLRLNHRALRDNLQTEFFAFYSPTDKDAFVLPSVRYRFSDAVSTEVGARLFFGEDVSTFFAQHEANSNVYARFRWRF